MTNGVGGSTAATELAKLTSQRDQAVAIGLDEYRQRIGKLPTHQVQRRARVVETGQGYYPASSTGSRKNSAAGHRYPRSAVLS